jgi:hypothetical protein
MTSYDLNTLNLDELRQYVLSHREDMTNFHLIDRSKSAGRMMTISPDEPRWEEELERALQDRQEQ